MRRSACPPGQMGNSEVGHLNLGAGFRVLQDLPRINAAIATARSSKRRRCCGLPAVAERGGQPPPDGARRSRRHPRHRRAHRRRWSSSPGGGCHPIASASTPLPMAATRHRAPPTRSSPSSRRVRRTATLATVTGRYCGDGPRRSLGSDAAAYDAIVHGIGLRSPTAAAAIAAAYGATRTTSSSSQP